MKLKLIALGASAGCLLMAGSAMAGPCSSQIEALNKQLQSSDAGMGPTANSGVGADTMNQSAANPVSPSGEAQAPTTPATGTMNGQPEQGDLGAGCAEPEHRPGHHGRPVEQCHRRDNQRRKSKRLGGAGAGPEIRPGGQPSRLHGAGHQGAGRAGSAPVAGSNRRGWSPGVAAPGDAAFICAFGSSGRPRPLQIGLREFNLCFLAGLHQGLRLAALRLVLPSETQPQFSKVLAASLLSVRRREARFNSYSYTLVCRRGRVYNAS